MSIYHVKIRYGPCKSLNDVIYRPRKLRGIRVQLQKLGYRVDFVQESWRDYCILEVCGHEVFRCNVRNLKFNVGVQRDPVAQRAVEAVVNATEQCQRARNHLWIRTIIFEAIFARHEFAPKDYWPFEVEKHTFSVYCKVCCGRLFHNDDDVEINVHSPSPPKSKSNTDESHLIPSYKDVSTNTKNKVRF